MNRDYKKRFPTWCNDIASTYDLVLSDDSDGLLVSEILARTTFNSIKYFYDFDMLYIEKNYKSKNKIIGCDIDFTKKNAKCWGNHVTAISSEDTINAESANLNNVCGIYSSTYTSKYAGSTLATVLSYYNEDISKLSEQAKMLIMCIDSHYVGFYNDRFHRIQKKWLVDVLEFPQLYDIIKKYEEQDFIDLARSVNIKIPRRNKRDRDAKIWVNNEGYLETEINLDKISEILDTEISLPRQQFVPYFTTESGIILDSRYANTSNIHKKEQLHDNILSYSQTFSSSASFTYMYNNKK